MEEGGIGAVERTAGDPGGARRPRTAALSTAVPSTAASTSRAGAAKVSREGGGQAWVPRVVAGAAEAVAGGEVVVGDA